ncbi:GMP/IMP nucleotidase [Rhabdochromatium marinum]|uniref:GMP/IMP nucleotidase n=1 Tax=Rhabdochromatium marinum TaxID=48729 RepID=UPI001902FC0A|nr:GMP/IMP nucleotidase [Rhabdochromatium marinum]MBK1650325.1 haloacid dehalogenase [Rhabdochromatium marinum]
MIAHPHERDWDSIDTVFLDMDGTLLDLHFDNHFWLEHVPKRYAEARGIGLEAAQEFLFAQYRDKRGTLDWYCIDHWTELLGLDIALLKAEVDHLIAVHPHVPEFLEALAARAKRRVLVTNAHPRSLALKLERTRLGGHFDRVICSHELRQPKEAARFWEAVQSIEPFDPLRTLFVDDNLDVLRTASAYGFRWLLAILQADSTVPPAQHRDFPATLSFAPLIAELGAAAAAGEA